MQYVDKDRNRYVYIDSFLTRNLFAMMQAVLTGVDGGFDDAVAEAVMKFLVLVHLRDVAARDRDDHVRTAQAPLTRQQFVQVA